MYLVSVKPPAQITLSVPKPCAEDWAQMTPADKGRFCAACQKTVIDFSVLSDTEIINAFKQADASLCGRFTRSQLDRPMIQIKPKYKILTAVSGRVAASLLVLQAFAGNRAQAQQVMGKGHTAQHTSDKAQAVSLSRCIKGRVLDYNSKAPMHGMIVQVKGTRIKTNTDKAGRFVLVLPPSFIAATFTLQVQYTETSSKQEKGYEILDKDVDRHNCGHLIIYRYVKEFEDTKATIVSYEMPLVDRNLVGGAPEYIVQRHNSKAKIFWYRISHIFSKRKTAHD